MGNFFSDIANIASGSGIPVISETGALASSVLGGGSSQPSGGRAQAIFTRIQDMVSGLAPAPIDYEALYGAAGGASVDVITAQGKEARKTAEANLARFPAVSSVAFTQALTAGTVLDKFLEDRFYATQDELTPGWRDNILGSANEANQLNTALSKFYVSDMMPGQVARGQAEEQLISSQAQQLLTGAIPADVSARVRQTASESSMKLGMFGQGAGARTARDLGLTSLDMITQGASLSQLATQTRGANINQYAASLGIAQAPIVSGSAYTNLAAAFRPPSTDVSSLYSNMIGQITGVSTVNPSQVLSTGGQVYGQSLSTAAQIAQANNEMSWNASLSGIGLFNDYMNRTSATAAGNAASNASLFGALGNLGGTLGSAAILS